MIASIAAMAIMAKLFSWPSHATVMAVNPTPPATSLFNVPFAPETSRNPTMPLIAPLNSMVRIMTQPTFMPAYRAVLIESPMTATS